MARKINRLTHHNNFCRPFVPSAARIVRTAWWRPRLRGGNRQSRHCIEEHLSRKLPRAPIDPGQIKQVLVNLCKNAIQAMTRGGALNLCTEGREDGVCLVVADTGGGIPQEMLSRIFEPFYTTKKKGSGLGLMIVQRIVRDHGRRIQPGSNVGQGRRSGLAACGRGAAAAHFSSGR